MQHRPRYKLMRRLLFPYSGEQLLTFKQGSRVVWTWALFFGVVMSLGTLPVAFAFMQNVTLQKAAFLFLLAFLLAAAVFGGFGLFVVLMNNQAAQIIQKRKVDQ